MMTVKFEKDDLISVCQKYETDLRFTQPTYNVPMEGELIVILKQLTEKIANKYFVTYMLQVGDRFISLYREKIGTNKYRYIDKASNGSYINIHIQGSW